MIVPDVVPDPSKGSNLATTSSKIKKIISKKKGKNKSLPPLTCFPSFIRAEKKQKKRRFLNSV
ncbi:MAG: hypothetical protein ACI8RD_006169 [Bacillariaceae sp.]|jgi:hypothetical protein